MISKEYVEKTWDEVKKKLQCIDAFIVNYKKGVNGFCLLDMSAGYNYSLDFPFLGPYLDFPHLGPIQNWINDGNSVRLRTAKQKGSIIAESKEETSSSDGSLDSLAQSINKDKIFKDFIRVSIESKGNIPYVTASDNPHFPYGTRFHFGFLDISLGGGYDVIIIGKKNKISATEKNVS